MSIAVGGSSLNRSTFIYFLTLSLDSGLKGAAAAYVDSEYGPFNQKAWEEASCIKKVIFSE